MAEAINQLPDELTDAEINELQSKQDSLGKQLVRSVAESLPMTGLMAGGIVASPVVPPFGSLAGAGLLYAAGRRGREGLLSMIGEGTETPIQTAKQIPLDIKEGVQQEMGGQLFGLGAQKTLGFLAPKINPLYEKAVEAAKRLGAKLPTSFQYDSPVMSKLEASLEQSPTIGGGLTRMQTRPYYDGVREGAEEVFGGVNPVIPSEAGKNIKNVLRQDIVEKAAPAIQIYKDIQASTKFMDVNPQSLNRISSNLTEEFAKFTGPQGNIATRTAENMKRIKTIDDIKSLRSEIGRELNSVEVGTPEEAVLSSAYDKLSRLEQNTIMRGAIKTARELMGASGQKSGEKIGTELIMDLKLANEIWKDIYKDVGAVSKSAKMNISAKNWKSFLDRIDNRIKNEDVEIKLFDTGNIEGLTALRERVPVVFEELKNAYLSRVMDQSMVSGKVDPMKLLKAVKKMEKPTRELVFGSRESQIIDDIQTLVDKKPMSPRSVVGQSGTPEGNEYIYSLLNPLAQLRDIGRFAVLKGAGIPANLLRSDFIQGMTQTPKGVGGLVGRGLSREIGDSYIKKPIYGFMGAEE